MTKLFKTTIVIISNYDPTYQVEIDELARDAMSGESYCTEQATVEVEAEDLDECVQEFFNIGHGQHLRQIADAIEKGEG